MEHIDLTELCLERGEGNSYDRLLSNALFSLMSSQLMTDAIDESTRDGNGHVVVQVEMNINGQAVKFSEWFAGLVKGWDKEVKDTAHSLIDNRLTDAMQSVDDAVEELRNNVLDVNRHILHTFKNEVM